MAKKESSFNLAGFIAWVTGVLVSLAVGSGMINQILVVPYSPAIITIIAGWIVVIGAIISIVLALFQR